MADHKFICCQCYHGFNSEPLLDDEPTECPKCGSYEIVDFEEFERGRAINDHEAHLEDKRLFRR